MTEKEIKDYIRSKVENITEKELIKIRNSYIYENKDLDKLISELRYTKWIERMSKSKEKAYYRVRMYNGGVKIIYACQELVNDLYPEYELAIGIPRRTTLRAGE